MAIDFEVVTRRTERADAGERPSPGALDPTGRPLPPAGGAAAGGTASGLFAGSLMWLALMAWSAAMGQGFWTPVQLVGGAFLGLNAVLGGFWAGALGVALSAATAAFWGAVFASLVSLETTPPRAFWAGLVYGASVWAVMTWIGLPILDRTLEARVGLMQLPWFACHLIYGAALLYTPTLRRRYSHAPSGRWDDGAELGDYEEDETVLRGPTVTY